MRNVPSPQDDSARRARGHPWDAPARPSARPPVNSSTDNVSEAPLHAARQSNPPATAPLGVSMHATPFSAVAALLDSCMLRGQQSGATCATWDVRNNARTAAPVLVFEHDSNGMCREELAAALGLGAGATLAGGTKLTGFLHAVLRLGGSATLLTKRLEAGKVLPSVGVGMIVLDPGSGGNLVGAALHCYPDQSLQESAGVGRPAEYAEAFALGGHPTWEDLQAELDTMPAQGTKVLIRGLWARAEGGMELDFTSDPADIRVHQGDALSDLLPVEKKDVGVQRCTLQRYSLRAYAAILYRRWPPGFSLTIRGVPVQLQDVRSWMRGVVSEEYRPRGIKDAVDEHGFQMQHVVNVHVGFLQDVPRTSMQGFCIYHRNRLIKPFWRVYSSNTVGRGVVGYLEVDFVTPTPDWQDFERSHAFVKLEAFLKRCVPAYWKKHAAAGGYLGGAAPQPMGGSQQQQQQQQQQMAVHSHAMAQLGLHATTLPPHLLPHVGVAGAAAGGRQHGGGLPPILTRAPPPSTSMAPGSATGGSGAGVPWREAFAWDAVAFPPSAGAPGGLHALAMQGQPGGQLGGPQAPFLLGPGQTTAGLMSGQLAAGHSMGAASWGFDPPPRPSTVSAFASDALGGGAGKAAGGGGGGTSGGGGAVGLSPAMHAMLQSFSNGHSSGSGAAEGLGGLNGLAPTPSGAGAAGAPPIHQLQRLLAAAPAGVKEQLQGMSSTPFYPLSQQPPAQQAQQGGGTSWDALPLGQSLPSQLAHRTSSSLDLLLLGAHSAGTPGPGVSPRQSPELPPQHQQAQQASASRPGAAGTDLAQALCMLVTQPRQLAQVVTLMSWQVQQAEQAGHPSSASLRRVYSLLSKLMLGAASDSPRSQGGSAPPAPAGDQRLPPHKPSAGFPDQPLHTQPPSADLPSVGSFGNLLAAGADGEGGRVAQPGGDTGPPFALQYLLAAAAAAPTDREPVPAGNKPVNSSPPLALAGLGVQMEEEVAAFVREAVPDRRLQQAGLQLAKRVRATVQQLVELQYGGRGRGGSPTASSALGSPAVGSPGAKRQRL